MKVLFEIIYEIQIKSISADNTLFRLTIWYKTLFINYTNFSVYIKYYSQLNAH